MKAKCEELNALLKRGLIIKLGYRRMSDMFRGALVLLVSAFVAAALLHSGHLVKHFYDSGEKIALAISGPRTEIGDNYYYFTLLRHAPERIGKATVRSKDPDGGDQRNTNAVSDVYASALYAGHLLYRLAGALTDNPRATVLLTSILNTCLLALSFAAFVVTLLGRGGRVGWFESFALAYVGLVFVDAFGNSAYFDTFYWADDLLRHYSNPMRLINPSLFWAAGLAAVAFIVRWIRDENASDFIGAVALASLASLFSISVGATLFLALALALTIDVFVKRYVNRQMLAIALAALSGLVWSYLQLRTYSLTSLGQDLRHGEFLGLVPKWQFLWLLGLIPFVWRLLGKERVFVSALVVSAVLIGMFCESFHLGSRLWLRGAVIYAWAVAVFVLASVVIAFSALGGSTLCGRGLFCLKAGAVATMVVFVFQTQRPSPEESWQGFVARDKWRMLEWIDANLPGGSVVASADIEDAFLIPIYTASKPLFGMYGLTNRTRDEELRRFFYTMRLYGRDRQLLESALSVRKKDFTKYHMYVMGFVPQPYLDATADAIFFLELVVYLSHVRELSNALVDPVQHQHLDTLLNRRAEEASRLSYSFDFAVVENGLVPPALSGWAVVYRNDRYAILRNPQLFNRKSKEALSNSVTLCRVAHEWPHKSVEQVEVSSLWSLSPKLDFKECVDGDLKQASATKTEHSAKGRQKMAAVSLSARSQNVPMRVAAYFQREPTRHAV